jgi:diguanylate cyclase (GGDEF)-like protein
VLEELQCRIASNVEVLEQLRQLQDLAARDFLTGLFNRRHFFARGRQLVSEAREMGLPISVAILDIDHFKRLNDRHGHDGGDKALTAVARTLGVMAERGFNLLARIGGEEFAIIFPGADLDEAERLCGDIRAAIAGAPLVINGKPCRSRCRSASPRSRPMPCSKPASARRTRRSTSRSRMGATGSAPPPEPRQAASRRSDLPSGHSSQAM